MILQSKVVGPIETNCYLLGDEGKGVCVLVDPGADAPALLKWVADSGLTLEAVFLTHGHYDHRDALPALLEAYPGLTVYIHEKERLQPGLPDRYFYGGPCRTWAEGDKIPVGDLTVEVLETPGHTAGSVVLLTEDVMLAGDTLFAGSCGRCDLPGGGMLAMFQSLRRLGLLAKNYRVFPGHGPATTLDAERRNNPYMRQALQL